MNHDLEQLQSLLEPIRQLNQEEIKTSIELARSLSSVDDKNYALCTIAEHLAITGGLNDLGTAIELALESTEVWERHFVLKMIIERLIKIRDKNRILQLMSQLEKDAVIVENRNNQLPSQKALLWVNIADLHFRRGIREQANIARAKAVEIASSGQYNQDNPQDVSDCHSLLRQIVGKLVAEYLFVPALQIVEVTNWHDKEAWIDSLKRLIDIRPNRG